ncbi:hypothetical protein COLO4_02641 [Corchorus olitorius]|uniref:Uncharacterized protein n=1 Tax=Corchorus olitorius TaxID=93759 RepID=A0A1R3L0Q5_9ROSI|nr:hypothetical protein COLO4_02641 [Corchorus olitorius]
MAIPSFLSRPTDFPILAVTAEAKSNTGFPSKERLQYPEKPANHHVKSVFQA